ncbi:MAG: hypothetical protein HY756_02865 [Nitrospirae bacterium]|nr:hypothetical protein [Nitrospirota bacterium]
MTRKQFIESQGATCKNWSWSWSFINESERLVIFGEWDLYTNGKTAMILSESWKVTRRAQKSKGYDQSREHIRLVEKEGYRLMTFPMQYSDEYRDGDENGPAKIGGFTPKLTEKKLMKIGGSWYAADSSVVLHKSLYIKDPARRQCCHSRGSNRESIVFLKQIKTWIPA